MINVAQPLPRKTEKSVIDTERQALLGFRQVENAARLEVVGGQRAWPGETLLIFRDCCRVITGEVEGSLPRLVPAAAAACRARAGQRIERPSGVPACARIRPRDRPSARLQMARSRIGAVAKILEMHEDSLCVARRHQIAGGSAVKSLNRLVQEPDDRPIRVIRELLSSSQDAHDRLQRLLNRYRVPVDASACYGARAPTSRHPTRLSATGHPAGRAILRSPPEYQRRTRLACQCQESAA